MKKILSQPSSWAGLGLLFSGIAQLVATKGADTTAWGQVMAGAAAVAIPEKGTSQ